MMFDLYSERKIEMKAVQTNKASLSELGSKTPNKTPANIV